MRRLLLRTQLSLGDIVVMTAAVRDLHRCYPGQFLTDVRTTCPEIWSNNPHITPLDERDSAVEVVECEYPLIHWSNQVPYHFLHGYADHLNEKLKLEIKLTEFRGDIHLSAAERAALSPIRRWLGGDIPYWLILAGGKHDVTIKWWSTERFQSVVDHFRGRIQFVQLGSTGDHHPPLRGVLDLRGRTTLRQLIQWVHHAEGVVCGVTGLMHLAAAVPRSRGRTALRPCVVVAGGREPVHWEAYPGHQFLHSIGMFPCCESGGCWRSRTLPLGDGDARDRAENRCVDVRNRLPACMDWIKPERVIESVEGYLEQGVTRRLGRLQARRAAAALERVPVNTFDGERMVAGNVRAGMQRVLEWESGTGVEGSGRGVVMAAGGHVLATCAYVNVRMLRQRGCRLPVEIWHLGPGEISGAWRRAFRGLNVRWRDAHRLGAAGSMRQLGGWELKILAVLHSRFREVLWLDADNVVVCDPEYLFEDERYRRVGAMFWPDNPEFSAKPEVWKLLGLEESGRPFETGQMLLDKAACWKALQAVLWLNQHSDFFYRYTWGDKETFRLGFAAARKAFVMPRRSPRQRMTQFDLEGRLVFQHRNTDKWTLYFEPLRIPGFVGEDSCRQFLAELAAMPGIKVGDGRERGGGKGRRGLRVDGGALDSGAGVVRREGVATDGGRRRMGLRGSEAVLPAAERFWVVTSYDEAMAEVGDRTSKAWAKYAASWGFQFCCEREVTSGGRHPAWNKVHAVLRAMRAGAEWVMWVDADTVPMNRRVDARELISPRKHVVFATDFNGLNSGIFLIRHCEWSIRFLEAVDFLGDVKVNPDGYGDKWEQNTMKAVLGAFRGHERHVELVEPSVMNSSVHTFQPGDFVLHLGGMGQRERLHYLGQIAQRESRYGLEC